MRCTSEPLNRQQKNGHLWIDFGFALHIALSVLEVLDIATISDTSDI